MFNSKKSKCLFSCLLVGISTGVFAQSQLQVNSRGGSTDVIDIGNIRKIVFEPNKLNIVSTNDQIESYNLSSISHLSFDQGLISMVDNVESSVENTLQIYPNPFDELFTLQLNVAQAHTANLHLSDMSGIVQYSKQINFVEGINTIEIPVANLAAGVFVLLVNNQSVKIVKK